MNLKEYTRKKQIGRQVHLNAGGLSAVYKVMSQEEKAILAAHLPTIAYNNDVRDCRLIHDKYSLSWGEIRYIIMHFCAADERHE